MISQDIIDDIRERANIEDIISRYVPSLKKKGRNYIGLCPFHKEKTPSFSVSPEKQIFNCFGCHTGGNVFSFISKIEHLTFPESVKLVGKMVGIDIPDDKTGFENSKNSDLYKVNDYSMRLYSSFLKSEAGEPGMKYLLDRGVTAESIDTFKLGYAPDEWGFLTSKLKKHSVDLSRIEAVGLVTYTNKNGRDHYYDKLRKRIIFPIINNYDTVVGFGGRVIDNNDKPKYLNSPESEIYHKRSILYGFNLARKEISELNRAIIVEGYLDVIGCYQSGIKNVVAPLGTALTEEQLMLLTRYCSEIILLFDSDSAGLKASLRSLELIDNFNVDVKVAALPEGDPFDYILNKGVREFMVAIDSAENPIDFRVNQELKNKSEINSKKRLINIFDIIKIVDFETERIKLLKKVSFALNLNFNDIIQDFNTFVKSKNFSKEDLVSKNKIELNKEKDDFLTRSYKDFIILLCNYPELISKATLDISEGDIKNPVLKEIFVTICNKYSESENITLEKVFDFFQDKRIIMYLETFLLKDFNVNDPDAAYTEIYLNIKMHQIERKIEDFADLIKLPENKGRVTEFLTEIEIWRREKEKISSYLYNMHNQPHLIN